MARGYYGRPADGIQKLLTGQWHTCHIRYYAVSVLHLQLGWCGLIAVVLGNKTLKMFSVYD